MFQKSVSKKCLKKVKNQQVPFVGRKFMNRSIGFLLRLRKVRNTCGMKQIQRCSVSSMLTITFGKTMGNQLASLKKSGMSFFSNICDNITAHVCFSRSEFIGLTATKMTRGDEFLRHLMPESEWLRFFQATVAEWTATLDTSAVTIISPTAAKDTHQHWCHRVVLSRRVCREKLGEGVGAASKATCRWCVWCGPSRPKAYAHWNDLLQRHQHHQSTFSCSLQRFSDERLPSVISSPRSCRVTGISLIGLRASSTQVFS